MKQVDRGEIILGAGCFRHVESSLRRLPGVIETKTRHAVGNTSRPTYNDVCKGKTGHTEVVKVSFDPAVCDPRKLIDCWLAMHDTTTVRAHGKRAKKLVNTVKIKY
jgi:peptide-methionine (S)-S-oxide reductase